MKVCLINPATDTLISDRVFPPLGLWYVSAALLKAGHEVEVVDMAFGDPIPEADIYGITGTTPQAGRMEALVKRIRGWAPDAWIIAGGPHATLQPEHLEEYGFDTVVRGEAEQIADDLVTKRWGAIIGTGRIVDLDSLPWPDRRQVDRYQFRVVGIPATMMITSRGCRWTCAFCCKPMGSQVALRSVDNILKEAQFLQEELGYQAINFVDDSLAVNPGRLFELADGLGDMGLKWRCFVRAQEMSPLLANSMAEGGCLEVGVGIESGSDRILHNIQKGETVEEIEFGVRNLQEAGIRVKGFFIIGLPGEDRSTLFQTEALLERLQLDDHDFTVLSVYPGSPIHEHPDRYDVEWNGEPGYFKADPEKYQCGVRTEALTQGELLDAREYLEGRFKRWV